MKDTAIRTVGKFFSARETALRTPNGKQLTLIADDANNIYVDASGIYTACGYEWNNGKACLRRDSRLAKIIESLGTPVYDVTSGNRHFKAIPAQCTGSVLAAFIKTPLEKVRPHLLKNLTSIYIPNAAKLLSWWSAYGNFDAEAFGENPNPHKNLTTFVSVIKDEAEKFVAVGMPKFEAVSYAIKIYAHQNHTNLDELVELIDFAKEDSK